eukprot:scaffold34113_cov24-Tisochrysis_lutea.AAC.1
MNIRRGRIVSRALASPASGFHHTWSQGGPSFPAPNQARCCNFNEGHSFVYEDHCTLQFPRTGPAALFTPASSKNQKTFGSPRARVGHEVMVQINVG